MNDASPLQPTAPHATPVAGQDPVAEGAPALASASASAPPPPSGAGQVADYAMLRGVLDAGFDSFAIAQATRAPSGEIVDFLIVELNARACAMVGRPREQLIGRPLLEIFPNSRAWKLWEQLCAVILTQRSLETTQHAPIPEEPDRWLQRQLVPLPGERVAISSRDITQRHRAQRALELSEARFRQLFENPSVVQLLVHRDTALIVDANAAAELFYGWSRTTLCTMALTDLASIDLAQWHTDVAPGATRLVREHWVSSGDRRRVELRIGPVGGEADPMLHCVVFAQDGSDSQPMAEQPLTKQPKAQAAGVVARPVDDAVVQVAGSIGHDLNNLLTVIRAAATFLHDGMADASSGPAGLAPLLEDVAAIERATNRAESLTRRLLAASRRASPSGEVLDMQPVLQQWLDTQIDAWPVGAVVLDGTSSAAPVALDPLRVRDVADTLIRQARCAVPPGGAITVHTGVEHITPPAWYAPERANNAAAQLMATLRVHDTASPVDDTLAARLAEPHFDPEGSDRPRELELAVAHTLVRQTGGFLTLHSGAGGTSVRAHWPAAT